MDLKTTATKAIVAAVVALGTGIGTQLADGKLTPAELAISAGAAVLAFVATFQIPNKPLSEPAGDLEAEAQAFREGA